MGNKKSICFIATVEFAVNAFLISHLKMLSKTYKVTLITNLKNKNFLAKYQLNIPIKSINFSRKVDIVNDITSLIKLISYFQKEKFDVVCTITPKAGLLGMLSSYLCLIPMRVHCFTGQIWATKSGISRFFFKFIDKCINFFSTHNIIDSKSQYNFLIKEKVINSKSFFFGSGSLQGVDLQKFKPNNEVGFKIRKKLNIPKSSFIFLFLGRLNKDKGIYDLIKAFRKVNLNSAYLLFVGPDEENVSKNFKGIKNIYFIKPTSSPQDFLATADILCLPSYREGFGNVVIEAAASGIPAIGSNIYGIADAILPNETGLLHKAGDVNEIANLLVLMFNDKKLVKKMGKKAMKRASEDFNSNILVSCWKDFFKKEIAKL